MRDSERRARLNRVLLHVQSLLADDSLTKRIRQAQGGYPSTTYGRMVSRSQDSPVEAQAQKRDPASADLDLHDQLVKRLADIADGLDDLRRRWPKPRRGTAGQGENDGCELCRAAKVWNAPKGDPTDLDGLLPRPYSLCSVCIQLALNLGRLPKTYEHAEAHDKGRVKVKATGR